MFDYEGEGVGYLEMVFTSSVEDGDDFSDFALLRYITKLIDDFVFNSIMKLYK